MSLIISGQKTVTTAGTEVALGSQVINGAIMVKALPSNTGYIYLGKVADGTVSSSTGLMLSAGDVIVFDWVGNLSNIMVDSSVNGEGVSWIMLSV